MAEAVNTSRIGSAFDRARLERIADWLAVAVVVSLPWSTSATGILIVVWLAALVPTLEAPSLRRELTSAPGGLPVLLWLLAVAGMLWAPVSFPERIEGLGGFHKLLVIPLLLLQFRRSGRGMAVLYAFLASCTLLLIASWVLKILWDIEPREGLYVPGKIPGIPVKDYIAQSTEFLVCAFGLLAVSFDVLRARRVALAIGLAVFALLFIANIYYVSPGRTALVVIPLLIAILGLRQYGWKGLIGASLAGAVVLGIAWSASPFLRGRVLYSFHELDKYRQENAASSTALRIEFWKKSAGFIATAPLIGHGTGSMPELFRRAAAGESGASAVASVNPHNQFFAVAVQLGLLGGAILVAMWVAHLALFRGGGLIAWIGLAIVLQNVVSSLFNSHLFDFFHGWFYVFGVGILGGMALRGANGSAPAGGASS
jgi:O-antigen ligase